MDLRTRKYNWGYGCLSPQIFVKNSALQHNSCSSELGNCPGLARTEAGGGHRPSPLSLCLSHCEGVSHQSGPHPEVSESTWPQVLLAGCSQLLLAKGLEAAAARSRASKCLWKRPAPLLGIFASLPRPLSQAVSTPFSHRCVILASFLAESHGKKKHSLKRGRNIPVVAEQLRLSWFISMSFNLSHEFSLCMCLYAGIIPG